MEAVTRKLDYVLTADTPDLRAATAQVKWAPRRPSGTSESWESSNALLAASDFAGPAHKVVRLYSESPLDQLPVAVLEGCADAACAAPAQASMTVRLSALNPKELVLTGRNSVDPGNPSTTR